MHNISPKKYVAAGTAIVFLLFFSLLMHLDYLSSVTSRTGEIIYGVRFQVLSSPEYADNKDGILVTRKGGGNKEFGTRLSLNNSSEFFITGKVSNHSAVDSILSFSLIGEEGEFINQECVFVLSPGDTYINGLIHCDKKYQGKALLKASAEKEAELIITDLAVCRKHTGHPVFNALVYCVQACFCTAVFISFIICSMNGITSPGRKESVIVYSGLTFVVILIFWLTHGMGSWDFLNTPVLFKGLDDAGNLEIAKNAMQGYSCWVSPMLAAPYELKFYDFPMIRGFYYIFCWIMGLFTNNSIFVYNLYYFCTYLFAALTFAFVCRKINISASISCACAVLFSFSQFHFWRSMAHANSSSYFVVPLVFYLCIMLYFDAHSQKKISDIENRVSYISRLFILCALIGSTDVFFAYFGCALLAMTVLLLFFQKKYTACFRGLEIILMIIAVGIINLLPALLYIYLNGKNQLSTVRSPYEAYFFGLMLVQLIMPDNVLPIHPLAWLKQKYIKSNFPMNEAAVSYIGIIAIFGLCVLFLAILSDDFCRRIEKSADAEKGMLRFLSVLSGTALLLGFSSGIGPIIALAGFQIVRTYNRISVYILLISLICTAYLMDRYLKKHHAGRLFTGVTAVLFIVVHILDTQPYSFFYYLKGIPQQKSIVEEYYNRVASQNKKDAMILQLPFLTYAENGTESGIWNANEQVYGYIFTEDIKWSYGSFLGTEEDTRQGALYRTSDFSKIFFNAISEGYSGISVNSDLYKDGPEIINMIFDQTGLKPAFSDKNKELFYYSLKGVDKEALNYKSESDNLIINGFEGKGWTNMEPSGRWAGGGMVSELVYPFVPDGNYRIHIEADSLIKQDVDIYLNDRYIDHFHAEQGNIIFDTERILDHDSMVPKGTNALRLVHSNYFIPSKLNPKSSDGRMLTLMYKSISIIRDK